MWELYLRVKLHVAVQFPSQVVCPSSPPLNFHLWLKKIFQSAQKPFYLDPVAHRILSSFGEVWQKRHVSEASPQWSVRVFGMTFVCAILVALKQGCHTTIPYIMGISGKKKKKNLWSKQQIPSGGSDTWSTPSIHFSLLGLECRRQKKTKMTRQHLIIH